MGRMFAVTIDSLPGYEIKEIFGEVLGLTARPQNAFVEGVRELSGTPTRNAPQVLRKWREDAVARMLQAAYRQGANAVIGMRFDHRAISAGWVELCAYGTAVFVVPDHRS
jgi:uncharacterized protein YbjQ (UPF0145 family)